MIIRNRRNNIGAQPNWDARNEQASRLIDHVENTFPIREKALFKVEKGKMTAQREEWINQILKAAGMKS